MVSMVSALTALEGTSCDCFFIVPEKDYTDATSLVTNLKEFVPNVSVISFSPYHLEGLPVTLRWTEVSWYRIFVPVLPELVRFERIVLLGGDTFAYGDIGYLFRAKFHECLAAVREPASSPAYTRRAYFEDAVSYFNADVLVYNTNRWRLENRTLDLVQTARKVARKIDYADQDICNIEFANSWFELPEQFNRLPALQARTYGPKMREGIIHWAGVHKPWDSRLTPPWGFTREWAKLFSTIFPTAVHKKPSRHSIRQWIALINFCARYYTRIDFIAGLLSALVAIRRNFHKFTK